MPDAPSGRRILAADIGGTNSRFAFFEAGEAGALRLVEKIWLKTHAADSFVELLELLQASGFALDPRDADVSVFAVAGAIRGGAYSDPPNIAYDVDLALVRETVGLKRGALINDFVAQAYACLAPIASDMRLVKAGVPEPGSVIAVIGAGTGLGKAALAPLPGGAYLAVASEGGHSSFPFQSSPEYEFNEFIKARTGQPYAWGDVVVSGTGLVFLHAFLTGEDLTPEQVATGISPDSETHVWFSRFYARACRNFALETYAAGGVYVAGGVAAKNPHFVESESFTKEFHLSPTYSELLRRIPVSLNDNEDSGLWGAALYGAMTP